MPAVSKVGVSTGWDVRNRFSTADGLDESVDLAGLLSRRHPALVLGPIDDPRAHRVGVDVVAEIVARLRGDPGDSASLRSTANSGYLARKVATKAATCAGS
ncbi:hypothetical protein GS531_05185 [Rhodococcus hoagii]|nr:hypothetical protein [Prescottella equi]